ncbi:TetR/AcrR family transcriptional regulator [Acidothermaceae bacterium B102]|nr:TetR/AcrR family transcriptional regulator [Acidothermaceae bacterium B102]
MARANVRDQLVDAAMTRFRDHGFNATGVKDITDLAGVPKGSFYNHFTSKESLGAEMVRVYGSQQSVADRSLAPLDRLRADFRAKADAIAAGAFARGCLYGDFGNELAAQSEPIRVEVEAGLEAWSAAVTALLREARTAGSLHSSLDDAALGRFVVAAWQGSVLRAKVAQDRGPLDDFFTVLSALLT